MVAPFIIVSEGSSTQRDSFARGTAQEAVAKAHELIKQGKKQVRIIDSEGRTFPPSEFELLLSGSSV